MIDLILFLLLIIIPVGLLSMQRLIKLARDRPDAVEFTDKDVLVSSVGWYLIVISLYLLIHI